MNFEKSKRHSGITRVYKTDIRDKKKIIAIFGKICDLTDAKIIQFCDCEDDEKFIIILATEIEKSGAHQNGKLFNTEAECIAECELIFLNAIFL